MKPNIKNIFDWLDQITLHKTSSDVFTEEDWGQWNTYMVNRFVSMNSDYIELVNHIQTIPYENKEQMYNVYKEMLPKGKAYFRYLKKKGKSTNKELLEYVSKYFECSIKESEEYISILSKSEVGNILTSMGIEDKEKKKLFKKP